MKTSLLVAFCCTLGILLVTPGCTQSVRANDDPFTGNDDHPNRIPDCCIYSLPTTPTPAPTTISPAIPLPKMIRDTRMLFTVSAPSGYAGTTIRAPTSAYNILYKTTIFNPAYPGPTGPLPTTVARISHPRLPDNLLVLILTQRGPEYPQYHPSFQCSIQ